jgi:hypothetical protein
MYKERRRDGPFMETWRGEVYRQGTALKMTYEVVKCFYALACTVTRGSSVETFIALKEQVYRVKCKADTVHSMQV